MQHLPTLVFRGDDQQLATDALRRSQRLLANPSEAELRSSSDAVDSTGWTWMTWIWRKHLRTLRRKPYFFYLFFLSFVGVTNGDVTMSTFCSYFFAGDLRLIMNMMDLIVMPIEDLRSDPSNL